MDPSQSSSWWSWHERPQSRSGDAWSWDERPQSRSGDNAFWWQRSWWASGEHGAAKRTWGNDNGPQSRTESAPSGTDWSTERAWEHRHPKRLAGLILPPTILPLTQNGGAKNISNFHPPRRHQAVDVRARCFHYRVYSSGIGPYRLSGKRYPLQRLSDAATPLQKCHSYRPRRGVRSCGPAGSISSCGPSRWVRSCGRQGSFASCGPSRWARSCGPQGSFASCGPSRWVRSCGPERSSSRSSRGVQGGGAVDDNQQQEATSVCATASHHRSGTDQGATPWTRVKREKTAASFTEESG